LKDSCQSWEPLRLPGRACPRTNSIVLLVASSHVTWVASFWSTRASWHRERIRGICMSSKRLAIASPSAWKTLGWRDFVDVARAMQILLQHTSIVEAKLWHVVTKIIIFSRDRHQQSNVLKIVWFPIRQPACQISRDLEE
jgi:hypothetical protein